MWPTIAMLFIQESFEKMWRPLWTKQGEFKLGTKVKRISFKFWYAYIAKLFTKFFETNTPEIIVEIETQ